ncbi:MAG: EAL domain-containing protein [Candidatus Competibacteraceae bacterium]
MHEEKQVIVCDILNEPACAIHHKLHEKHGLRSCISTPIVVGDSHILGTLDLYRTTTEQPSNNLLDITTRLAGYRRDCYTEKGGRAKLSWQARHDNLTGLVNRREFERRIERLLHTIQHDDNKHAMCFLDLDQFKIVNDTCGHTAGDELLRQLATIIHREVRKRDTLARLGGDEFAVIMEHCTLDQALRVANVLLKAIQDYVFSWEGYTFRVGASIGLVSIDSSTPNFSELLKQADAACYMAKDLGRNRIHIYYNEDESLVRRHGEMQWVTRIQRALEENRYCLYAQRMCPLLNRSEQHYELLIRMIGTDGGHILPGAFLPAAERYNMMAELDKWVIDHTFNQLQTHREFQASIDMLSINISGQSLTKETFLEFVRARLKKSGIDTRKICFEITETSAITNLNLANDFIAVLHDEGCRFALDDFGSGLSSFGYLKNLNVDFLKIDGMFVRDIATDPIDRTMVRSINEIGQALGIKTIAEFVENDEIKNLLREIGVDYAQGYGIHKPQLLTELIALL